MGNDMYSVEQVADLLDLHVRTVRGYIRSGRLRAVRIGKQYRIAPADLDALLGRTQPPPGPVTTLEVSSIVQLDGVDRAAADRLATLVLAGVNTHRAGPLRVQTVHDEERQRMKIVLIGGACDTAEVLHLLDAVLTDGNGLLAGEAHDG
ncbi:helix-turn-helix domain-containing protein [Micromonospora halophytica]|uniref:DNA binding domain-containing protein, excisionase family n=1 Tax=Micromonospora halophytica TaxID=47864 RepID=A0A1C5JBM4_9ACTN|nr:helix-turn-helix domain-containing protein [Micromonospora halophytica]SCG67671.1 DNA binding domain-containing protein, excisionase family [Micromonospora halophytica]